jgi:hypothetical protein
MTKQSKPKIGRPRLTDEERASKKTFSIITSADLEARLQEDAERNKRNRNAEVIARLEASYSATFVGGYGDADTGAVSQIIERLIYFSQLSTGGIIWDDPQAHKDLKADVCAILDAFGPEPGIPASNDASPRARGQLTQIRAMKAHGRQGDESADAYAAEEIVSKLSPSMAKKLEMKE